MNKPTDTSATEQSKELGDQAIDGKHALKPFVEPRVSVPTDVLEATTLFQAPTIEASTV